MNRLLLSGCCSICLLIHQQVSAQGTAPAKLSGLFNSYASKTVVEKIYVHTDKQSYLAGETAWFKLYNVDGTFHKPLSISKLAYVEVLDAKHVPILQAKIKLEKGSGHGSFQLPLTIPSGNYILRAYTGWMKNFDPEFYFEKNISVLNTLSEEPITPGTADSTDYDIQFFPEGGNLLADTRGKLAFRVADRTGKGIDCKGALLNENGDTVARFTPLVKGIGSFEFVPLKGATYKALLLLPGNRQVSKELPRVHEAGYALQAISEGENLVVKVASRGAEPNETLHLFVHARNAGHSVFSGQLKDNLLQFVMPKDNLPEGISHLTLFNNKLQPLCERLFFKPFFKKLFLSATTDKKLYTTRKKVVIDLEAKDHTGLPLATDLSLAVIQKDPAGPGTRSGIESYLLLASDLKGHIEDPGYYFSGDSQDIMNALDNLMLTHGWRRFTWQDVTDAKKSVPKFLPEAEGHIISGTIVNRLSGKSVANTQTYLSVAGKKNQLYSNVSDTGGKLNYYTKNYYGVKEIVVQPAILNRDLQINIATPFSEEFSSRSVPSFEPAPFNMNELQQRSVNMQVQNAYHAAVISGGETSDTLSFYGKAEKKYLLDDYVRFPTMQEVLREYVTEINVNERNKSLRIALIRRYPDGTAFKKDPLVLVDGVPLLGDQNKIFRYDPLLVRELHIINHDYFLGTAKTEGIVNFVTYKGLPPSMELDPETTVVDYEGLQMEREFFQPVYETPLQAGSRMPDFRNVLLWNPRLKTNASGKSQISFYTSDLPGTYSVVIEGLSGNGQPGSQVVEIEVGR